MVVAVASTDSRDLILRAAYREIHRRGFQAASLDRILDQTGLTKGSLYHHFVSKQELGYAVVDEVIAPYIVECWVAPLADAEDPVGAIMLLLEQAAARLAPEDVLNGCALNNLAQEMSPIDAEFRVRLNNVVEIWRTGFAAALRGGQQSGCVRRDIDPDDIATFLVAAIEGCAGMAKNARNPDLLASCAQSFRAYLEGLRPKGGG